MSHIYIKEPPTNGKVLLKTTLGDIDVELWSKETPLACRNFVQLCLERYYDGTIFHRLIQDFVAQGGDPTGTGEGGESVYGHPFKDEFHSRLKFVRRGMVAMANGGPNDNTSQFFFTLGRADELNNKHTIFGKVAGDTLYNMVRFNDIPTDKEDRPLDPAPKIVTTEVLLNPFDDIVPRIDHRKVEKKTEKAKSQSRATKNFSLLSFGEEAEEDEEETVVVSKELKIKSSHDVLTQDPRLSSQPAVEDEELERSAIRNREKGTEDDVKPADEEGADDEVYDTKMRERVRRKLKRTAGEREGEGEGEGENVISRKEELRREAEQLKRELHEAKTRKLREKLEKDKQADKEFEGLPEPVKALRKEQAVYKSKKKALGKGGSREHQTLELLTKFKSKLFTARTTTTEVEEGEEQGGEPEEANQPGNNEGDNEGVQDTAEEETQSSWLSHRLAFDEDEQPIRTKDASVQNEDTFDIYDPRHPINKRRREENKKQLPRQKRDRTRR